MYRNTKVATCNYCGTRAALVLSEDHHVLVCQTCGAPLGDLKAMPGAEPKQSAAPKTQPSFAIGTAPSKTRQKSRKKKKKKSPFKRLFAEVIDEIEDLFD